MRVKIEAGGRIVEIECADDKTTSAELADRALAVWQATDGAPTGAGPAFGFSADRRNGHVPAMNYGVGPGRIDRGSPMARDGDGRQEEQ